ncbi:MAG TPA: SDR family NAD(P)-dependent oxidoreductase [Candidatus Aenigmarchaeota archaeon]|nr:SDR family NAD(P)-dependent oxidoreductase [Candidatus Aenigmarchaeota archaeon]
MERILVTGGAGFIGSHTVDLLIEKGFKVRVLDNLEPQVHRNKIPDYLNPEAEFMEGDITNIDVWKKALQDVDAVIHLAAMVGVGQSMYQPIRYLDVNTIGTANFFKILVENKELRKRIKKIIVASSKSIYGEGAYVCKAHGVVYPPPRPIEQLKRKDWEMHCPTCGEYVEPVGITEEKIPQNLSVYALSKYDTERLSLMFGHAFEIPTIAFRYFNVYGPRQSLSNPYTGVCAIFLSRIKNNNPPIIYEDGNQVRDFIYVEDIARVNLVALEKFEGVDVFNVGTGKPTSILEVANTLIEICDSNVEPKITQEFRVGDNRHDFADITKIKKALGWEPKWSLKKGFEKLVEWSGTQEAIDMFEKAEEERRRYLGK